MGKKMGAKESEEMREARRLIVKDNMPVCSAARHVGLSYSAIYVTKWYKEWKKTKKNITNK